MEPQDESIAWSTAAGDQASAGGKALASGLVAFRRELVTGGYDPKCAELLALRWWEAQCNISIIGASRGD